MSVDKVIANNLRIARQDLDAARLLAASGNRNAMYLCEQAAEKIIRAVLTSEGKHAGIRHDLEAMVDLVPDANPLKPQLRTTEQLTVYATSFRYVRADGSIPQTPRSPNVHLDRVEQALTAAVAAFGVELDDPVSPARRPAPFRG